LAKNKNNNTLTSVGVKQTTLRFSPTADEHLDIARLETWLWDAACAIRGATDAPKFKDFILPLIFYKRLSDVFDDEAVQYVVLYGDEQTAYEIIRLCQNSRKISLIKGEWR
jgi:type I restriction enzyme M protein